MDGRAIPVRDTSQTMAAAFDVARAYRFISRLILFFVIVLAPGTTSLTVAQSALTQMLHMSWTPRDGAPQSINAIVQAPDGRLWIGSDAGLFIFDGIHFTRFTPVAGETGLPVSRVISLCFARNGALWVGMELEGAARIQNGHVSIYTNRADGMPLSRVANLQEGSGGSMWALTNPSHLIRFGEDNTWRLMPAPAGAPDAYVRGNFFDSFGTQWVTESGRLYRRSDRDTSFSASAVAADYLIGAAEAPDGTLWITDVDGSADRGRLQHLDRNGALIFSAWTHEEMSALLFSPNGQLWLAKQQGGIVRVTPPDAIQRTSGNITWSDNFGRNDGLSSSVVTVLFRDREGNTWAGGKQGLDRFNTARLIRLPYNGDSLHLCASAAGRVLIYAGDNHLYAIDHGLVKLIPGAGDVHLLTCGENNEAWYVDHGGLWNVHKQSLRKLPPPPGWIPYGINALAEMKDGSLIVGRIDALLILKHGKYFPLSPEGPPKHSSPLVLLHDAQDRLWLNYGHPLWVIKNGFAHKVGKSPPELGVGTALIETSHGVLLAGTRGLAIADENTQRFLPFAEPDLSAEISGGVEVRNHDVWLNGARGIVRLPSAEIDAALRDTHHLIAAERVAEGDYVGPAPLTLGTPTVVADASGRLWFATLNGIVSLNPDQPSPTLSLPTLSIHSIVADGRTLNDKKSIPPGPQTLDIQYFGVNLTAPEGVTYKYKLDGLESDWQDVGHRAEAIYTHLRPGKYRFEVIAANANNGWSQPVVCDYFTVLPYFYQTWWFYSLAFLAFAMSLALLFHNRLQRSRQLVEIQLRERYQERTRIARELHDTLLQGFHGLALRLGVTVQMIPPTEPVHAMLEDAMKRVDEVLVEGRKSVNDLRAEQNIEGGIADEFEQLVISLGLPELVCCKVLVTGRPVPLHPRVRYEMTAIGREALTNAVRHSMSSEIRLVLDFLKKGLRLTVTDNGKGITSDVQSAGRRAGHWGLDGMRERATSIGGTFDLTSNEFDGTTITVTVPSYRAYSQPQRSRLGEFWMRSGTSRAASQD